MIDKNEIHSFKDTSVISFYSLFLLAYALIAQSPTRSPCARVQKYINAYITMYKYMYFIIDVEQYNDVYTKVMLIIVFSMRRRHQNSIFGPCLIKTMFITKEQ